MPDIQRRLGSSIRVAIAFGGSAMTLYALGFGSASTMSALGASAVLYGENSHGTAGPRSTLTAGLALVAAAAITAPIGSSGPESVAHLGILVCATIALTAVIVFVLNAIRSGPPGPFFIVLAATASSIAAYHGVAVSTILSAIAVGALGGLVVEVFFSQRLWSHLRRMAEFPPLPRPTIRWRLGEYAC